MLDRERKRDRASTEWKCASVCVRERMSAQERDGQTYRAKDTHFLIWYKTFHMVNFLYTSKVVFRIFVYESLRTDDERVFVSFVLCQFVLLDVIFFWWWPLSRIFHGIPISYVIRRHTDTHNVCIIKQKRMNSNNKWKICEKNEKKTHTHYKIRIVTEAVCCCCCIRLTVNPLKVSNFNFRNITSENKNQTI